THPLGFGYTRRALAVWRDHSFLFEVPENPYITVARLTADPHLSGYVSDENAARLAGSPSVVADQLGQGSVVLLIDNPNFRGYWRGTNRLLLNALFFGDHIRAP
ncbi:MAG: zinc carboxypeptidase, partial [Gemmatimonadota bacterium]|nr:zinc carboxypeptidase [Gemmatimonadota bacterium]